MPCFFSRFISTTLQLESSIMKDDKPPVLSMHPIIQIRNRLQRCNIIQYYQKVIGIRRTRMKANTLPGSALQNLIALMCSVFILGGCSSAPLLDIVEQTGKTTTSITALPPSQTTFGLYDISTFDVYVDSDVIHIIAGGKPNAGAKQTGLSYARSEDGGRHWINPIVLANFPATINNRINDVQLAAKGQHLLTVWQTKGELPGMGPLVSAYSENDGLSWKQGTNPALNNTADQSHTDLIADQNGYFHAVWLEDPEENGYQSLRYAHSVNYGKHWSKAETLDNSTCSCCWNTFALSPENKLNILYRDMKPRDMALQQSFDGGNSWQRTSTVGEFNWQFDGCPHVGGSLAYSQSSTSTQLHSLVWTGVEQKAGLYYLSSENNGISWSSPKQIGKTASHGDIASFDGIVMAIWDEMEADGTSIFYATSEDGGLTWLTAKRLTAATAVATHPRIVATKQGFLALWTEKPNKQTSHLAWQIIE